MLIRQETPEDIAAIAAVIAEAFVGHPYSKQTEGLLVEGLRKAGALAVSLVAEEEGEVIGHIAFSAAAIAGVDEGWMVLAPIAVRVARQRLGVGQALMRAGLAAIRAKGALGCVLVGDPAFYARFGFRARPGLVHAGVPPEYVLALSFGGLVPTGEITCHPAFAARG